MAILSTAYIQAMLGGATTGAAKLAAFGDATAIAGWIARADAEVVSAANRGGYTSVIAATPSPAAGTPAFDVLVGIAFDEWWALANLLGRDIDVGYEFGTPSAKLYRDSPEVPRVDLPGLERDALGGTSGGEIANGTDLTTNTPSEAVFPLRAMTAFC